MSKLEGNYTVDGLYTNMVSGCSVFPVSLVRKEFKFSGKMSVAPGGAITGQIVDKNGQADITGQVENEEVKFKKQYLDGSMAKQPPIWYRLKIARKEPYGVFTLKGNYRFSEDQEKDDGEVTLIAAPLPPRHRKL